MAIKLDPETLRGYAQQLKTNADKMVELAGAIATNIGNAADNWEGKAKERYLKDYENIKPTLDTTVPQMLMSMSENLSSMANQIEEVDASLGQ